MATTFPTASAWTAAARPALVQGLESAFLSDLRAGLPSTPYLSRETRNGVKNLIRREAPVRLIGDALLIAYASDWARRQARIFGKDNVSSVWHGADRLFEPLSNGTQLAGNPDLEIRKARFIEDFGHLDLMARATLEVRLPRRALQGFRSETLAAGFSVLDDSLRPFGFAVATRPDADLADGEAVLRFFSLSALELGLYVFLGSAAPRFCLGPGGSAPAALNGLREAGYRLIPVPTHRRKAGGVWRTPLSFVWHHVGAALG
jgi:hypothetical protein